MLHISRVHIFSQLMADYFSRLSPVRDLTMQWHLLIILIVCASHLTSRSREQGSGAGISGGMPVLVRPCSRPPSPVLGGSSIQSAQPSSTKGTDVEMSTSGKPANDVLFSSFDDITSRHITIHALTLKITRRELRFGLRPRYFTSLMSCHNNNNLGIG